MVTPFSPSTSLLPKGWQASSGSKKVLRWFLKKNPHKFARYFQEKT